MEIINGLLDSLGINPTLFAQFCLFLVGFGIMHYMLFKPYNEYANERFNRTVGNEETANQFDEDIELLKRKYSDKAFQTNKEVQLVFSQAEQKAMKDSNGILERARDKFFAEKQKLEKQVESNYKEESAKVPSLAPELKESLKQVLVEGTL